MVLLPQTEVALAKVLLPQTKITLAKGFSSLRQK
jgi:hypothetical protein